MKRRLLSQILCRQHVCLTCASLGNPVALRATTGVSAQCRYSVISNFRQNAVGHVKENEDGDFSMLKQNAGLSFPSRTKAQDAAPVPRAQPQAVPGKSTNQQNQTTYTPLGSHKSPLPDTQLNISKQADRGLQRGGLTQSGVQRRQNADISNRGQQESGTAGPFRMRPSRMREDNTANGTFGNFRTVDLTQSGPQSNGPRQFDNGGRRNQDRLQANANQNRNQQKSQSPDPTPGTFRIRKFVTGGSEREPRNVPMPNSIPEPREPTPAFRKWRPDQTASSGRDVVEDVETIPEVVEDPSVASVGVIDAPVGSSFDTFDPFHSRRPGKTEKRARRTDRFDDGTDEAAPAENSKKPKIRGRNFDIEALEAEEILYGGGRRKKNKKKAAKIAEPARPTLQLPEFIGVEKLAQMLKVNLDTFIRKLEEEGFEGARYDHVLDSTTSAMFADLYGFEPLVAGTGSTTDLVARPPPEDPSILPPRPPIVTIMGHVDHGKTTILDFFRKSSVVASEHGGITQHIGAFSVTLPGTNRQITFLDTPGHAAFLEMRRRGANVTDIVVLVVAADDSVKPQTIEAIKHSLDANVQIIVAINKIDKPEADIERVKQDLSRHQIVVEDYGGDYQVVPVSGKTGQGMSDLEEAITTLSDINDHRAELDGPVEGWVIESKVTTAGRVATVLVRRGTLRTGDCIVAGTTWARVRTLRNDAGALVDSASPGTPVQVDGWRGEDPMAGLEVLQAESEDQAKDVVDLRLEQEENMKTVANMSAINNARSEEAEARAKVLAWEKEQEWAKRSHGRRPKDNEGWVETGESSGPKKIHFVVKADVAGSVEALVDAVGAIGTSEIATNVIHSGTGALTESDIRILATTGEQGYAISFNQSIDGNIARLAEAAGLTILDHNIIYKVTDNVKDILADNLPPVVTQRVTGEAEVGQIFEVTIKRKKTKIAGCRVTNGTISRTHKVRVLRNTEVVFIGTLDSLKHVKKDVTEMRKGTECGISFEEWEDFQPGDQVQCFEEHHEKRTLY